MVQIILFPDVLDEGLTHLRAQLALRTEDYVDGVTCGDYLPTPHPAVPFVWMRRVGGFTTGRALDRARVDYHVYHENDYRAHQLTQMVRGILIAWPQVDSTVAKLVTEFSGPGPVPDPLWPDASRWYGTVEITMRGVPAA